MDSKVQAIQAQESWVVNFWKTLRLDHTVACMLNVYVMYGHTVDTKNPA